MQTTYQNQASGLAISNTGIVWLKLAVLYLMLGVGLGIAMGASQNFTLRPVHAHVNLLGWTTLALAGLIYSVFPQAGHSKLAKVHFWMMNLAMPVMMVALSIILLTGNQAVVPFLAIAEFVAAGAIIAFAANLFLNLKPQQ
ncbi:cytochrome-c oxidase [Massilia arenosa]|uniref:Cytochrome-c oxidase n=1 Tax=Zemynaea arenosa TaxID=2561931 RepID=A0A4Y9SPA0_9BURK|nr:cytochrome-c oxidase [Massilia arenosa]TFW28351.1 cytochrome-c oxidase [Massilia arenosa]